VVVVHFPNVIPGNDEFTHAIVAVNRNNQITYLDPQNNTIVNLRSDLILDVGVAIAPAN